MSSLKRLNARIIACRRCPRLVAYRELVARVKKREFQAWDYWGRPVPGFGDPRAELLIIGLAPAAHGANRTGRMFTGDGSGRWLMRALHRAGFASQPTSEHRGDGLRLRNAYVTAVVRCVPPDNRPTPREICNCASYLREELTRLTRVHVVITLGQIAFTRYLALLRERGVAMPAPSPVFGHGAAYRFAHHEIPPVLIASYHPSRQNTQTGRLTAAMLNQVFRQARRALGAGRPHG